MFSRIVFFLALFALQDLSAQIYTGSEGRVSFTSEAPLETINASSEIMKGALDPSKNTFAFTVDIASFDGFNSALQRSHFNENYLESSKFPTASFAGEIIEQIDWMSEGTYDVRAKGMLKIHGVQQERIIRGIVTIGAERIDISSNFKVLLAEHSISIPKIVAQKISKEIDVSISTSLTSNEVK